MLIKVVANEVVVHAVVEEMWYFKVFVYVSSIKIESGCHFYIFIVFDSKKRCSEAQL